MGKKKGYIDRSGKIVIQPDFDRAWSFVNGLAEVEVDGNRGYIDKQGAYVWGPTRW